MHKISDKDKKIWNFYVSNLKSIKKVKKKTAVLFEFDNKIGSVDDIIFLTYLKPN